MTRNADMDSMYTEPVKYSKEGAKSRMNPMDVRFIYMEAEDESIQRF